MLFRSVCFLLIYKDLESLKRFNYLEISNNLTLREYNAMPENCFVI